MECRKSAFGFLEQHNDQSVSNTIADIFGNILMKYTMKNTKYLLLPFAAMLACTAPQQEEAVNEPELETTSYTMDTHSFARPEEAAVTHLDLDIVVDFESRNISGAARYTIRNNDAKSIVFDMDGLAIESVSLDEQDEAVEFEVLAGNELGQALSIPITPSTKSVTINYRTGEGANALDWLSAEQTADKKFPFLFTQGQAVLTRSWIPCQDSPGIRYTYNAKVKVPVGMLALMSASNPQEKNESGVYEFTMEQAIPSYLMALAVGDIEFQKVGERTGVYAEPSIVEKAAWEFGDMEQMLTAAEELYGPYRWDQYDVIVLPPSFPFGGMENPRLTFATPTILAGDRSLNALIAHELAHSWSGNLVTNATWNDFWLNEGFTVYFEKRISEAIYGRDFSEMLSMLGHQDLVHTVEKISAGDHPEDTHLYLDLEGRNPDDGMTEIAYEKGYHLLRLIEETVGREQFDTFLKKYFETHAFQSMTTDKFIDYLNAELLVPANADINLDEWIYGPGLPDNCPKAYSNKFELVEEQIATWVNGTPAADLSTEGWSTFEWMHFVRQLPDGMTDEQLKDLDNAFGFTNSGNSEVLFAWLMQCLENSYEPAYPKVEEFLTTIGRRKFVQPLFEEMVKTEAGKERATAIYAKARSGYHSVTVRTIDGILDWPSESGR